MAKRFVRIVLTSVLCAVSSGPAVAAVARFDTTEITIRANRTYDGGAGSPNPFVEVTLSAEVRAPGGRTFQVDGFFDGNGAGGMVGDVWKVRVFADEAGLWSWRTTSNLPALHGHSGTFDCAGTLGGVFAAGPIVQHPQQPRSFKYRDGAPVYLLAKFLDEAAPARLRYSHTLLSEQLGEADRQAMLERHRGMSLNKMNVYLANRGDYGGVSTTPWKGTAAANDKARFDLARWHMYERWVRRLRDAGLVAQLWFFADDSGFGDLPEADRKRLIRYGMARLSGSVNTMFTLALEWQEGWSATEVDTHARFIHQHNPWDRLVSVHGVTGDFSFPGASWADYMDVQAGNDVNHATVHASSLRHRASAAKPLIQEEHGLGQEDLAHRQKAWAAFTGGAAGIGTGAFLRHLASFIATVPFERMAPAAGLVRSGLAYVLAEPGQVWVAYLPQGGPVGLDLSAVPGSLAADWFDPRSGTFSGAVSVAGGALRTFTPPGAGDWTLRLRRSASPPTPPPPTVATHFYTLRPCRVLDTRRGTGGISGSLRSGQLERLTVAGACGVPLTARAVSVNATVVSPSGMGHLSLWPGGLPRPSTSTVSFNAGGTRAAAVVVGLGGDGTLQLEPLVVGSPGTVHVVLDVSGYFL